MTKETYYQLTESQFEDLISVVENACKESEGYGYAKNKLREFLVSLPVVEKTAEETKNNLLKSIQDSLNSPEYNKPEHEGEAQAIHHAVEVLKELVPAHLFSPLPYLSEKGEEHTKECRHNMFPLFTMNNYDSGGKSSWGEHKCAQCGKIESWQYDNV